MDNFYLQPETGLIPKTATTNGQAYPHADHNVVYQTARADLLHLEELGLLVKLKQGKAFVFYAADNLVDRFQRLNQG